MMPPHEKHLLAFCFPDRNSTRSFMYRQYKNIFFIVNEFHSKQGSPAQESCLKHIFSTYSEPFPRTDLTLYNIRFNAVGSDLITSSTGVSKWFISSQSLEKNKPSLLTVSAGGGI